MQRTDSQFHFLPENKLPATFPQSSAPDNGVIRRRRVCSTVAQPQLQAPKALGSSAAEVSGCSQQGSTDEVDSSLGPIRETVPNRNSLSAQRTCNTPRLCANKLVWEVSVGRQSVLGKSVWVGEEGCKAEKRLIVLNSRLLEREGISCRTWPQHTGPLPRLFSVSFPLWPMLKCYLLKIILWDRFQLPPFQVRFNLALTVDLLKVLPVWLFLKK